MAFVSKRPGGGVAGAAAQPNANGKNCHGYCVSHDTQSVKGLGQNPYNQAVKDYQVIVQDICRPDEG